MDISGMNSIKTNSVCQICNQRPRAYTCPKCNLGYCSLDCYKSDAHLECTEMFYKQWVLEELKTIDNEKDKHGGRKKMLEILKRVHDEDEMNIEALANSSEDDEGESDKEIDSDDEDVPELAKRLCNVNLDNADEVWSALTDTERQEFEALIKNGDIEKLLPQWTPWWLYHAKKELIQEMHHTYDERTRELPSVIDVSIFPELQKASRNVEFNLVNVIYAYAYIANYYNGDYLNCPLEATCVFLDLCDNMKAYKVFEDTDAATAAVIRNIVKYEWLPQDEQMLLRFKEAGNTIMQGPHKTNKYLYIAVALSELHRLFTSAKEELGKNKRKEFSKKFTQSYNMNNTNISKKLLFSHCKKLEYYLSWVKSCHIEMYS